MSTKSIIGELIETFIVSFIVLVTINIFIGSIEQVWGASMEPSFHTGERILVDKISKNLKTLKRGEVVIVESPQDEGKHYIKRVIGLPGDIVKILDCHVYVLRDGEKYVLDEPYLADGTCTPGGQKLRNGRSIRLDDSEYMVLGDNRPHSVDSRVFGFLTKENIVGRVVFRFWPLSKISFVR